MTLAVTNQESHQELLVIERLAAALEKAASVDEIKDVRDRAMAIQLYTRKKAGGLAAAQSAGRVVTDATAKIALLYHEEKAVPGKRTDRPEPLITELEVSSPSKAAVARAADMAPQNLNALKPLAKALRDEPERIEAAKVAIESRGDVATPSAVVRELTAASSATDYDGDEWYTPPNVIRIVRDVLGGIDLDAASNPHAQKTVQAARYFTKDDNALVQPWGGRVFCNPPYSMPLIEQFTAKLLEEYDAKRVKAAVYLVNNCTDSAWFHTLLSRFPVCFTRGRIAFLNRQGQKFATRQGQAIFYLGKNDASFRSGFSELGEVVRGLS